MTSTTILSGYRHRIPVHTAHPPAGRPATLRHPRHRLVCLWPRRDVSGLWPVTTWMCWTWERVPLGRALVAHVAQLRTGSE